jgi:hypothetical protein
MSDKFKRTIEDFICGHCGAKVKGNGYTNHCPVCLWSKHVDVFPGDRKEECGGMMQPVDLQMEKDTYIIVQECQKCSAIKRCRAVENDQVEALEALSAALVKKKLF